MYVYILFYVFMRVCVSQLLLRRSVEVKRLIYTITTFQRFAHGNSVALLIYQFCSWFPLHFILLTMSKQY